MKISTFLPHVGVFGGVRRFLELGNAWVALGHEVTLYHPEGAPPGWLPYRGRTAPLVDAARKRADLALCADPHTLDAFLAHPAAIHLYYCVIEGDPGVARALRDSRVRLAANSGALRGSLARRTRRTVLDGVGGINLAQFRPDPSRRAAAPLRVLLNGRRSRPRKGTDLILAALRGLEGSVPPFEIVLFDARGEHNREDPRDGAPLPANARYVLDPTQDELVALYQSADLFVAAERRAGWCNTALEAMACGAAVVCTPSGTRDFARHLENAFVVPVRHAFFLRRALRRVMRDAGLRDAIAAHAPLGAGAWSWDRLALRLIEQVAAPE
jgi:glycosyltransferase involved in cell wall biosynthesis